MSSSRPGICKLAPPDSRRFDIRCVSDLLASYIKLDDFLSSRSMALIFWLWKIIWKGEKVGFRWYIMSGN